MSPHQEMTNMKKKKTELPVGGWVILAIATALLLLSVLSGLEGEPLPPTLDAPETWASPTYEEHMEQRRREDSLKEMRDKRRLEAEEYRELRQRELEESQAEQAKNISPPGAPASPPGP
jgi:hypothetical protein